MKKILLLLNVALVFSFLFSACSVEKRRYMSGYNVQWKNSKHGAVGNVSARSNEPAGSNQINSAEASIPVSVNDVGIITASTDNSPVIRKSGAEKINNHTQISTEECDVITLKNGEEIKGKVTEVTQSEIKYKKCDDLNGQTYTLKKSEVFMIKYPNGTKDVIAQDAPSGNKPTEKEDNGVFGVLSFTSAILSYIIPYVGLLLIPAAIVLGAIGAGKKRKHKGFAIVGLIIGIASVLLILIFIASFPGGLL